MVALKNTQITVPFMDESLKCPFCRDHISTLVAVDITAADVRHVGTEGMQAKYSVTLDTNIVEVSMDHVCKGKIG